MMKQIVQLEHAAQDKVCRFVCDHDAPIQVIKDALVKFLTYVGQIEQQIVEAQKAKDEEAKAKAEVPSEPVQEQPKAE